MANRDLLKEAIADAKAVKETAIANAKAALEEAFRPHMQELLAKKLEEMDLEEEGTYEGVDEMKEKELEEMYDTTEEGMDTTEEGMDKKSVDEVDLEELLKELDSLEEDETINLTDFPDNPTEHGNIAEAANFSVKLLVPTVYYDSETGELADSPYDWYTEDELEDASVSSFDDGNELAMVVFDGDMKRAKEMERQYPGLFKVGNKMMNEAEVETSEEEEIDLENMSEDDLKSFIESVIADMVSAGELEAGDAAEGGEGDEEKKGEEGAMAPEEDVNLEELMNEIKKAKKEKEEKEKTKKEVDEMKKKLDEAYSVIKTIKSELDEVNLFNAKLLYTNKIFKAKNLTESQKVKVLAAFDKAASVKEAKLVYETLSDGFTEKKTNINESVLRGSASKPAGIAEKKPILEVNDQFARWQKLAGIK